MLKEGDKHRLGWGRRWEEVRDAHAKAQVLGGGWVMGVRVGRDFFFFLLCKGKCATATRSKCKGSKKGKNTAMGGMVSYDGTEPSPGWEERVVGGKLHHPGCGGEVDEIMLRLTYKFIW